MSKSSLTPRKPPKTAHQTPRETATSKRSFTDELVPSGDLITLSGILSPDPESWFTPSTVDQTSKRIKLIANRALCSDTTTEMTDEGKPEKTPMEKFLDAQAEREIGQAEREIESLALQKASQATLVSIQTDVKSFRSDLDSIKTLVTKNATTLTNHAEKIQKIENKMLMIESQLSKINTFEPTSHRHKPSNRLLIFNLPGLEQGQDLIAKVQDFFENTLMVRGALAIHARRFPAKPGKPGTILVTLEDQEAIISLLSNGFNLKDTPISISEDLAPEARAIKSHILQGRRRFIVHRKRVKPLN